MSDRPAPAWRKEPESREDAVRWIAWQANTDMGAVGEQADPTTEDLAIVEVVLRGVEVDEQTADECWTDSVLKHAADPRVASLISPPADADLAALRERVAEAETAIETASHRASERKRGEALDRALATLRELAARVGVTP